MLAVLGKAKYFTTLDLKSGYLHISLNDGIQTEKVLLLVIEVCISIMSYLLDWPMHLEYPRPHANSLAWCSRFCYGLDDILMFSTSEEHKQHI